MPVEILYPSSSATLPGSPKSSIRVLLVNDHAMLRQTLRDMLEERDHIEIVGEARNGLEAIDAVPVSKPDVVVMDINLPVMNGIEATKYIKADFPNTAVIGLSVQTEKEIIEKMRAAGISSYLTKGSTIDMVCRAIEDAASSHEWSRV